MKVCMNNDDAFVDCKLARMILILFMTNVTEGHTSHFAGQAAPADFWLGDGSFIVSDQAYCSRQYQLQPFSRVETKTQQQELFNRKISLARRVVERLFGMLKKRWQVRTYQ
jgi:hypothetical protein